MKTRLIFAGECILGALILCGVAALLYVAIWCAASSGSFIPIS